MKYAHIFLLTAHKMNMLLKKGISIKEILNELLVHQSTGYRGLEANRRLTRWI